MKKVVHYLHRLDGWPVAIAGVLILGGLAFLAERSLHQFEAERLATLADLEEARIWNYDLAQLVEDKEAVIASFQDQIGSIAGTVGTLEKLAQTDEELLKKYSKVYFLNENYRPARLTSIDQKYLQDKEDAYIHTQVWPYLERLILEAQGEGFGLRILSAFRSFETQALLKNGYKVTYGSGANTFSADQGYSEHQLGTTVDFTTTKIGANLTAFEKEPVYDWLLDNAHRFGFILSYPQGNTYYKFEPWHWRYVGVELATWLWQEKKSFYDLDQREIDQYLVKLFE